MTIGHGGSGHGHQRRSSAAQQNGVLPLVSGQELLAKHMSRDAVERMLKKAELVSDNNLIEQALTAVTTFHIGPEGDLLEAAKYAFRRFELHQTMQGAEFVKLSQVSLLAHTLRLLDRVKEILDVYTPMLEAREEAFGYSHPKLLSVCELILHILLELGMNREASQTVKRLVRIREQAFPTDPEETAKSEWETALIQMTNGAYSDAEASCRRALALLPRGRAVSEPPPKRQARRKQYKGEETYTRLARLEGKILGTHGLALQSLNRQECETAFKRGLSLLCGSVGMGERESVIIAVHIVRFLTANSFIAEAERVEQQAVDAMKARADAPHSRALMYCQAELGWLQLQQSKNDVGVDNLLQAVSLCKRLQGRSHWEVSAYLRTAATFHENLKHPHRDELRRAEAMLDEALELEWSNAQEKDKKEKEEARQADHTPKKQRAARGGLIGLEDGARANGGGGEGGRGWARTVRALGCLYVRMGRLEQAQKLLTAFSKAVKKDNSLDTVTGTLQGLQALAELQSQQGDNDSAMASLTSGLQRLVCAEVEADGQRYSSRVSCFKTMLLSVRGGKTLALTHGPLLHIRQCDGPDCEHREASSGHYHVTLNGGLFSFCSTRCRDKRVRAMKATDYFSRLKDATLKKIIDYIDEVPWWGRLAQVSWRWWSLVSTWRTSLPLPAHRLLSSTATASLCARSRILKFVDLSRVKAVDDFVMKMLGKYCHSIITLSIRGNSYVTDDGIDFISRGCYNLIKLDIGQCEGLSDEALQSVARLDKLDVLSFDGCQSVTEVGVLEIARGCKLLRELDISFCPKITDSGLTGIVRGCQQLERLTIHGVSCITEPELRRAKLVVPTLIDDYSLLQGTVM